MYKRGITGVDDPTDPNSCLFKKDSKILQNEEIKKREHLVKRQIKKLMDGGVSDVIGFNSTNLKRRKLLKKVQFLLFGSKRRA
jgi:hypothetical protein